MVFPRPRRFTRAPSRAPAGDACRADGPGLPNGTRMSRQTPRLRGGGDGNDLLRLLIEPTAGLLPARYGTGRLLLLPERELAAGVRFRVWFGGVEECHYQHAEHKAYERTDRAREQKVSHVDPPVPV